jgi:hypothetical protein
MNPSVITVIMGCLLIVSGITVVILDWRRLEKNRRRTDGTYLADYRLPFRLILKTHSDGIVLIVIGALLLVFGTVFHQIR